MVKKPPYLSYSRFRLVESSPEDYHRQYVLGEKWEGNKYTEFGKKLDEAVEFDKPSEDPIINHLRIFVPRFKKCQYTIKTTCMKIPTLGKLDGFDPWKLEIDELKSGKNWSQSRVDKDDQLTFYALLVWQKYKKHPSAIRLHWAKTIEDEDGNIQATGDLKTFLTDRAMPQMLELAHRMQKAWKLINQLHKQKIYES